MTAHSGGTRAQVLGCLAVLWGLTALRMVTDPPAYAGLFLEHAPGWLRAVPWGAGAVVAGVAMWWRWLDPTAWGALYAAPFLWFCAYLIGWGFGTGPLSIGAASGLLILYGALVFLINRCAKGLDRLPRGTAPTAESGRP